MKIKMDQWINLAGNGKLWASCQVPVNSFILTSVFWISESLRFAKINISISPFICQNDVEALASKLPPNYATVTWFLNFCEAPRVLFLIFFYRPSNLTSFFPISVRGFPKDFSTDHGTSHMLSEFLWSPQWGFCFVRTMGKPWLPLSYATELDFPIGPKKKARCFRIWGWWNWTCSFNLWLRNLCI
jgi:hypothetical protein